MSKVFRALSAVAVAASLMVGSSMAFAANSAAITLDNAESPSLAGLLGLFGISTSAVGADASYAAGTFTSVVSSDISGGFLNWTPSSGLKFTSSLGSITFDNLAYNLSNNIITSDVSYTSNGGGALNDVEVFKVVLNNSTPTSWDGKVYVSITGMGTLAKAVGYTGTFASDVYAGHLTASVTPAVPEPETWALGLAGAFGVLVARRRRQA